MFMLWSFLWNHSFLEIKAQRALFCCFLIHLSCISLPKLSCCYQNFNIGQVCGAKQHAHVRPWQVTIVWLRASWVSILLLLILCCWYDDTPLRRMYRYQASKIKPINIPSHISSFMFGLLYMNLQYKDVKHVARYISILISTFFYFSIIFLQKARLISQQFIISLLHWCTMNGINLFAPEVPSQMKLKYTIFARHKACCRVEKWLWCLYTCCSVCVASESNSALFFMPWSPMQSIMFHWAVYLENAKLRILPRESTEDIWCSWLEMLYMQQPGTGLAWCHFFGSTCNRETGIKISPLVISLLPIGQDDGRSRRS